MHLTSNVIGLSLARDSCGIHECDESPVTPVYEHACIAMESESESGFRKTCCFLPGRVTGIDWVWMKNEEETCAFGSDSLA